MRSVRCCVSDITSLRGSNLSQLVRLVLLELRSVGCDCIVFWRQTETVKLKSIIPIVMPDIPTGCLSLGVLVSVLFQRSFIAWSAYIIYIKLYLYIYIY